jgi:hypothetical protein
MRNNTLLKSMFLAMLHEQLSVTEEAPEQESS